MGNQKLEDGNLCKDCAKQLSPWFSDRRRSTVEDIIKRQLAYREENRGRASQFRTTRSYGEDCKVLLDEEHRWFTVTRARDLADANPDILDYTALTGCRVDIDESRTEQKREGPDGKEVSYNPPRYEYSYDFEVIISVNNPYFDEMKFRLNNSSVYIEPQNTMQRPMMGQQGMGQRPMAGRPQSGMAGQRPMMNQPGMNQRPMAGRPRERHDTASHDGTDEFCGPDEYHGCRLRSGEQSGISQVPRNGRRDPSGAASGDGDRPWRRRSSDSPHAAGGPPCSRRPPCSSRRPSLPLRQRLVRGPAPPAGGQNDGKFCEYCGAPRG